MKAKKPRYCDYDHMPLDDACKAYIDDKWEYFRDLGWLVNTRITKELYIKNNIKSIKFNMASRRDQ